MPFEKQEMHTRAEYFFGNMRDLEVKEGIILKWSIKKIGFFLNCE